MTQGGGSDVEVACKPSSVPGRSAVYGPSRRTFFPLTGMAATIYLGPTLPSGSSGQPGDGPGALYPSIWPCSGWGLPGLWCYHQSGELLPHLFTLASKSRSGMFLWHFPSGRPAPPLAGILARWSSDFPPSRLILSSERDGGRPATSISYFSTTLGDRYLNGVFLDHNSPHVLHQEALTLRNPE